MSEYSFAYLKTVNEALLSGLEIHERVYNAKRYPKCFLANECVNFMISHDIAVSVQESLDIGTGLIEANFISPVQEDGLFENSDGLFQFSAHEYSELRAGPEETWVKLVSPHTEVLPNELFIPEVANSIVLDETEDIPNVTKENPLILDDYKAIWLDNVRPLRWVNPYSNETYSLAVIGGCLGGYIVASGCSVLGRTALIEPDFLLPDVYLSTALRAFAEGAKVIKNFKEFADFGVEIEDISFDFEKFMSKIRREIAKVSYRRTVRKLVEKNGVDLYFGQARFIDRNVIEVNGELLRFDHCCICPKSVPRIPDFLADIPYHTVNSILNIKEIPESIAILGSNAQSLELAQIFVRLDAQVVLITNNQDVLPELDSEISSIVIEKIVSEGVLIMKAEIEQVENIEGLVKFTLKDSSVVTSQTVIVCTAMDYLLKDFNLPIVDVTTSEDRIVTNDYCCTSNKNIYCIDTNDLALSENYGRIVLDNIFKVKSRKPAFFPVYINTDPSIACIGKTIKELKNSNVPYKVFSKNLHENDRAICEGRPEGVVEIIVKAKSDEIVGARIVSIHAEEIISEITLGVAFKKGLGKLREVIHPYPTISEDIRHCGDDYTIGRLTPNVKKFLRWFIKHPLQ